MPSSPWLRRFSRLPVVHYFLAARSRRSHMRFQFRLRSQLGTFFLHCCANGRQCVASPSSPSGRTAGLGRHHVLSVRALSSLSRESLSVTLRAVLVRSSEPNISPARFETRDDIYFEGVPARATLIKDRLFSPHVARRALKLQRRSRARITRP